MKPFTQLFAPVLTGFFLVTSCASGPTTGDARPKNPDVVVVDDGKDKPKPVVHEEVEALEAPLQTGNRKREGGRSDRMFLAAGESKVAPSATIGKGKDDLAALRYSPPSAWNTESYDPLNLNTFLGVEWNPLSTFSIDVDTASYANIRRFLSQGQLPPKDAVRIEEMVNYFTYNYPAPTDKPFSVSTEVGACPWNAGHQLMHIGIQGKKVTKENLPPNNLVFLIDVSGSMDEPNKLPLLIKAFTMLTGELRPQDRVAIVVYAGRAGLVLPPTSGVEKMKIREALERLQAGGSTAGGEGILLAYETAKANFLPNGNNRVILATDGDFNVGVSSDGDLVRLIEEKRKTGIFLSVLGFGMGNYKDSKMEKLADKGNGNYAYIDNLMEAEKVFVTQMGGTLLTIAKDVKIQVEFNPKEVKGYRLIGYEKRMLKNEDFKDDKVDAGEIGAGHTVTALYEIIPASSSEVLASPDNLKYRKPEGKVVDTGAGEVATVKLRYKEPKEEVSKLLELVVKTADSKAAPSENLSFASAVAEFGLILRGDDKKGNATFDQVIATALSAKGEDLHGYRAEFLKLAKAARSLSLGKAQVKLSIAE